MQKRSTDISTVLDLIDGTLEDYAVSADAMRWTPERMQQARPATSAEVRLSIDVAMVFDLHMVRLINRPTYEPHRPDALWIPCVGGQLHGSLRVVPYSDADMPRFFVVNTAYEPQSILYRPRKIWLGEGNHRYIGRVLAVDGVAISDLIEAGMLALQHGWKPEDSLTPVERCTIGEQGHS